MDSKPLFPCDPHIFCLETTSHSRTSFSLLVFLLTLSGHLEVIDAFLYEYRGAFHSLFTVGGRSAVVLLAQWLRHRA